MKEKYIKTEYKVFLNNKNKSIYSHSNTNNFYICLGKNFKTLSNIELPVNFKRNIKIESIINETN